MSVKTSQELLGDILDRLDIILNEQTSTGKTKKESTNDSKTTVNLNLKGEKDVVSLLSGLAVLTNNKNALKAGDQITSLSKGISEISKIKPTDIKNAAKSIDTLVTSINAIKITQTTVNGLKAISGVMAVASNISALANIDIEKLNKTLKGLKASQAKKLGKFINALTNSIDKEADFKKLEHLNEFMSTISSIINVQINSSIKKLNPIKAYLIAKSISVFLVQLNKALSTVIVTPNKKLAETINTTCQIINMLANMNMTPKQRKIVIQNFKKILKSIEKPLINFINKLKTVLPFEAKQQEKWSSTIDLVIKLLNEIGNIGIIKLYAFSKLESKEKVSTHIATFIQNIIKSIPSSKDTEEKSKSLLTLFNALSKISIAELVIFAKMGDKVGTGIQSFLEKLHNGLTKFEKNDDKKIKSTMSSVTYITDALLKIVLSIAIMTGIVMLAKPENILIATGIIAATIVCLWGMTKLLATDEKNEVNNGVKSLKMLCQSLLIVVGAIAIMTAITVMTTYDNILGATVIIGVTIAVLVGMTKWLSKKSLTNSVDNGVKAMQMLTISLLLVVVAIGIMVAIVKNNTINDIFWGIAIVTAVIAGLIFAVKFLSPENGLKSNSLAAGVAAMGVLTVLLIAISLTIKLIIVPLGKQYADAWAGLLVVGVVIGAMVGATIALAKWASGPQLPLGIAAMIALGAIFVALSYMINDYVIPIGEKWDKASIGCVIIGVIIAGMIYAVKKLDELKAQMENMRAGLIALGVLTAVFSTLAYIIKEYVLPIGQDATNAIYGSGLIVGIIGALTVVIWALSEFTKKANPKNLLAGVAAMEGIALVLGTLALVIPPYIDLVERLSGDGMASKLTEGEIKLVIILGTWGAMMAGLGYLLLLSGGTGAGMMAAGAAAIAGIGVVIGILGKVIPPYIDLAERLSADGMADKLSKGSEVIVDILTSFGWLMVKAGVLVAITGGTAVLGGPAILGIAVIIDAVALVLMPYIPLVKKINENKAAITGGSKVITDILTDFGLIIAATGAMMMIPGLNLALGLGAASILGLAKIITTISKALDPYVNLIIKIQQNHIDTKSLATFKNLMVDDDNSFINVITNIAEKMLVVSLKTSKDAGAIAKNIRPIFDTISIFLDVIQKSANLRYVTEWNNDGTPKTYGTITPDMLKNAGVKISQAFGTFLTELGKGLEKLNPISLLTLKSLSSGGIKQVVESISIFTSMITSALTHQIADRWDKEGKPIHYRIFNKDEFKNAAEAITTSFATFLSTLDAGLLPLGLRSSMVINTIKDSIGPVMNAVKTYTDAILSVMTGKEYTITENGKDIKKFLQIDPKNFTTVGGQIAETFINFVESLWTKFGDADITSEEIIDEANIIAKDKKHTEYKSKIGVLLNSLGNMGSIINVAGQLMDSIVKFAEYSKTLNMVKLSQDIADTFTTFVRGLNKQLGAKSMVVTLENTEKNVNISKKIIETFKGVITNLIDTIEQNYKQVLKASVHLGDVLNAYLNLMNIKDLDKRINNAITNTTKVLNNLQKDTTTAYNILITGYASFLKNLYDYNLKAKRRFEYLGNSAYYAVKAINTLNNSFITLHKNLKDKERERDAMMIKIKNQYSDIGDEIAKVNAQLKEYNINKSKQLELQSERTEVAAAVTSNKTTKGIVETLKENTSLYTNKTTKTTAASDTNNNQSNVLSKQEQAKWSAVAAILADRVSSAVTMGMNQLVRNKWSITVKYETAALNSLHGKMQLM